MRDWAESSADGPAGGPVCILHCVYFFHLRGEERINANEIGSLRMACAYYSAAWLHETGQFSPYLFLRSKGSQCYSFKIHQITWIQKVHVCYKTKLKLCKSLRISLQKCWGRTYTCEHLCHLCHSHSMFERETEHTKCPESKVSKQHLALNQHNSQLQAIFLGMWSFQCLPPLHSPKITRMKLLPWATLYGKHLS